MKSDAMNGMNLMRRALRARLRAYWCETICELALESAPYLPEKRVLANDLLQFRHVSFRVVQSSCSRGDIQGISCPRPLICLYAPKV